MVFRIVAESSTTRTSTDALPVSSSSASAARRMLLGRVRIAHKNSLAGAGPAGLTTAWQLAKAGKSAALFEQDALVGGIARADEYKGQRFDIGGHRFFTQVESAQQLWVEILDEDFLLRPRLSRIHYESSGCATASVAASSSCSSRPTPKRSGACRARRSVWTGRRSASRTSICSRRAQRAVRRAHQRRGRNHHHADRAVSLPAPRARPDVGDLGAPPRVAGHRDAPQLPRRIDPPRRPARARPRSVSSTSSRKATKSQARAMRSCGRRIPCTMGNTRARYGAFAPGSRGFRISSRSAGTGNTAQQSGSLDAHGLLCRREHPGGTARARRVGRRRRCPYHEAGRARGDGGSGDRRVPERLPR